MAPDETLMPDFQGPTFATDADLAAAQGTALPLSPDQARHARRVLRLSAGDRVRLIDGNGTVAQATLTGDDPAHAACHIDQTYQVARLRPLIHLCTAIPKGPRGDAMVNDLAQLGADTLTPMTTQRSVVDPGGGKLERYRKAAVEAAKQSGHAWSMRVRPTTAFGELLTLDKDKGELGLVADPRGAALGDLPGRLDSVSGVRVLIGPEGGLTDTELAAAKDAGFVAWRFNPFVLRIETAAAAAVAILRHPA